jgi:3-hydroxyisobutyrate dehydrogenase
VDVLGKRLGQPCLGNRLRHASNQPVPAWCRRGRGFSRCHTGGSGVVSGTRAGNGHGDHLGAMVAPPLIAVVLGVTNWRWIFVLAGAFGLLWTAWWQWSASGCRRLRASAAESCSCGKIQTRHRQSRAARMSAIMAKPSVAILGLGIMGSGMAARLLSADFPLAVYNRNREKCVPLGAAGAFVAPTPRDAASRAEIVLSMVADDAASRDVWLGESGALKGVSPGSVLIESSTLRVDWVRTLAAKAVERHCKFLDAPVTGTKPHAGSGELLFLVGGSAEALQEARPVFSVLGRDVIHLGPIGSGAMMKLVNNFLCGVQAASFAEALCLVDAGGLDRAKAISILTRGAPGSGILKRMADRETTNDFTAVFALQWMAKDLAYALDAASDKGVPLPVATASLSVFRQAMEFGFGGGLRGGHQISAEAKEHLKKQRDRTNKIIVSVQTTHLPRIRLRCDLRRLIRVCGHGCASAVGDGEIFHPLFANAVGPLGTRLGAMLNDHDHSGIEVALSTPLQITYNIHLRLQSSNCNFHLSAEPEADS